MNLSESLKNAENSLRDFISYILSNEKGKNWITDCGVSEKRIEGWNKRRETERKKFHDSITEKRLLYYADFYDLKTILKKNWSGEFSTAFGNWKTMEVFLSELEKYRNPEAHRRDFLPYQKHLVIGICGEIRNKIVKYRSMKEEKNSDDYYPRLERISDNLGNVWTSEIKRRGLSTGCKLHVGDQLTYIVAATDPLGGEIEYGIRPLGGSTNQISWSKENELHITIKEGDVRKMLDIQIYLRSLRKYHAHQTYDDVVNFRYEALPPIQT